MAAGDARLDLLSRAERALAAGQFAEAERDIAGALALDPGDPRALKLHAAVLQRRGRVADAVAALRRAATHTPDDPQLLNSLGIALAASGDHGGALAMLRRAAALAPGHAAIGANLGKMLVDGGSVEEGATMLRAALERVPVMTHARFTLAYAERVRGRIAEAEAELRIILAQNAHDGDAWLALADLGVRASDADIATMQAALDDAHRGRSRIALRFALARALDGASRYDDAWHQYRGANGDVRRDEPWDAAADRSACEGLLRAFDGNRASAPGDLGHEIIFIVSLPRSGSTLVEQILASHPDVARAASSAHCRSCSTTKVARRGVAIDTWAPQATADDWKRLGRDYLARTAPLRAERPRSTDKRPGNWRSLGAIRRMLPGARIVVCRRDPRRDRARLLRSIVRAAHRSASATTSTISPPTGAVSTPPRATRCNGTLRRSASSTSRTWSRTPTARSVRCSLSAVFRSTRPASVSAARSARSARRARRKCAAAYARERRAPRAIVCTSIRCGAR